MTPGEPAASVYDALGNVYAVLPAAAGMPTPEAAADLCRSLATDGLLIEIATSGVGHAVRVVNPDGSEAETSGNGVRIFARWLYDQGRVGAASPFAVRTGAGATRCEVLDAGRRVRAWLGPARFANAVGDGGSGPGERLLGRGFPDGWRFTEVDLGNPHAVVFGAGAEPDVVALWGPRIEHDPRFPHRTNVQFVTVLAPDRVRVGVWERGAGATPSSGSSACAAVAACRSAGLVGRDVAVAMPGGTLRVVVEDDGTLALDGPVARVAGG